LDLPKIIEEKLLILMTPAKYSLRIVNSSRKIDIKSKKIDY
jgi:hypothetical protein